MAREAPSRDVLGDAGHDISDLEKAVARAEQLSQAARGAAEATTQAAQDATDAGSVPSRRLRSIFSGSSVTIFFHILLIIRLLRRRLPDSRRDRRHVALRGDKR